jgi:hypothetical protein
MLNTNAQNLQELISFFRISSELGTLDYRSKAVSEKKDRAETPNLIEKKESSSPAGAPGYEDF